MLLRDGQIQLFGPRDEVLAAITKANQEQLAQAQAAQQRTQSIQDGGATA